MRALILISLLLGIAVAANGNSSDVEDEKVEKVTRIVWEYRDNYRFYRMAILSVEFVWVCCLFIVSLLATELLRRSLTLVRQINRLVNSQLTARAGYYQLVEEKQSMEK